MVSSIFSLPYINMMLSIFRLITFFGGATAQNHERAIRHVMFGCSILVIAGQFYWKYSEFEFPTGQVAYCTANMKSIIEKSNIEGFVTVGFEVFTILIGFLLIWLYVRENKVNRSYDISVNLCRKQLIQTMTMFLPYSIFHVLGTILFVVVSGWYRSTFSYLDEPYFSAGSGYTFVPLYLTVISPWILYSIIRHSENRRISKTEKLLDFEKKAKNAYFQQYQAQWCAKTQPKTARLLGFHSKSRKIVTWM
ncbi:unnamed protein product, partial [Mesorhabditis spiculigera]